MTSLKIFATLVFTFFFLLKCNAQSTVDFGIKSGLNFTFFKVREAQFGNNIETEADFYGGIFVNFNIDEVTSFQPEILYIGLNDFRFLNAPLYAKFRLTENLHFMAGPSLNYFFDFFNNKFKVRGDIATGYQITDDLDVHLKFVIGFNEVAPNGLFLGLGYKL